MKRCALLSILTLALFAAVPAAAQTSTFVLVNLDAGTGAGLADPTPVAPVGLNPGTTLGQQRINVFIRAMDIWSRILGSPVPIRVAATFNPNPPLACTPFSAVLGAAGPNTVFRDFPGAPVAQTWFVEAEANSLAGFDLGPGTDDISAFFNPNLGTPGCLNGVPWYLGLDNAGPANSIDLLTVVLHELGHGLGFLSLTNGQNGALLAGFHDIWNDFLFDMTSFLTWRQMTAAQRAASAINVNPVTGESNLTWVGTNVFNNSGGLTGGTHSFFPVIEMFTANPFQPGSSVSHYHTQVTPNELMEPSFTTPMANVGLTDELLQDIGWATTPTTFTHFTPIPGTAGSTNLFTSGNGIPGATTFLVFGTIPGPFVIGGGCPNLGMTNPTVLASGVSNPAGQFNFSLAVPPNLAGFTVLFQAVEISGATCNVSNLVTQTF